MDTDDDGLWRERESCQGDKKHAGCKRMKHCDSPSTGEERRKVGSTSGGARGESTSAEQADAEDERDARGEEVRRVDGNHQHHLQVRLWLPLRNISRAADA